MAKDLMTYNVWLLINGYEIFPLSTRGFERTQGSLRSVIARSSENLFLSPEGETVKISGDGHTTEDAKL